MKFTTFVVLMTGAGTLVIGAGLAVSWIERAQRPAVEVAPAEVLEDGSESGQVEVEEAEAGGDRARIAPAE